MKHIIGKGLEHSMSYLEYRELITQLLNEGKTTGPNQSEAMVHYTQMNQQRMNRLDKKDRLTPELRAAYSGMQHDLTFLVITEGWCGDASQIVPIFYALAESNPRIDMRLILRDDNPEVMDQFLINGSRSIPVLVVLDRESLDVLGVWGARPKPAQVMVDDYKKLEVKPPYSELSTQLQKWYNKDKTLTLQTELLQFAQEKIIPSLVAS